MSNKLEVLASIVDSGAYDSALSYIKSNEEELLALNPVKTIEYNIKIYLFKNEPWSALDVINDFQNRPLISVEVELYLRELKDFVFKSMQPKKVTTYSLGELEELLNKDTKHADIAFKYIFNNPTQETDELIIKMITNGINERVKKMALAIAMELKIDQNLTWTYRNFSTKINPSKLNFDEYETNLKDIKDTLKSYSKNITINNIMNELFDDFMYRFFPLPISEINKEMMLIYLEAEASKLLDPSFDIFAFLRRRNIEFSQFETFKTTYF